MVDAVGGIAIVNRSSRLSQADAERMVDACAAQMVEDFAPAWGCIPCTPKFFASLADVPAGMATIIMVPKSDVDGAAGYHTEDANGHISGIVAVDSLLDAGWSLFDGAQSISCCLSHECLEAAKDPFVNVWIDLPEGGQDSFEMCDRVQGNSYKKNEVSVSDFLLPHAFDDMPPLGAKFDFLGILTGPFEVAPGGYAARRDVNGKPVQVGLRHEEKYHPMGRGVRRLSGK